MDKPVIISLLQKLANHALVEITARGDNAIAAALSVIPKDKTILIPDEGGWLSYPKIPKKLGLKVVEVKCDEAKISLADLQEKLKENPCGALLYQNPGGYFAEQVKEDIYASCRKRNCLVIMDVSGSIGTKLCNGNDADILVGSFGEWKLVEAKAGGFFSCSQKNLFEAIQKNADILEDEKVLKIISQKLKELPVRVSFLVEKRKKIIKDMKDFEVIHKEDLGFVVVVKFKDETERERIINYCKDNNLPWTECPRYIRLNQSAISIEVKRL